MVNKSLLNVILSAIFLLISAGVSAQDYRKYHEQINDAERLISNKNFEEALDLLRQVFNKYDFVFQKDYQIAAQLAVYLDEKGMALKSIREGIADGWELKALKNDKYLAELQDEPEWETIEKAYPDLRRKYLNRIDQSTRESVRKMFKEDQRKALGALLRIGDKSQEKYALKKFAPHSETQIMELIKILENRGYPGEQLIGNNFWMSTIISHHNSIAQEYVNKDTLYNFIKPMLIQAIEKGQISPIEYALIDDWYIAVSSDRSEPGYGFLNPPYQTTLFETNQLRQKIGLRSIELRNKLVDVENSTGMNFYLPDWIEGKIKIEHK